MEHCQQHVTVSIQVKISCALRDAHETTPMNRRAERKAQAREIQFVNYTSN